MTPLKCPGCGLISPEGSVRCECGWRFDSGSLAAAENHRIKGELSRSRTESTGLLGLGLALTAGGAGLTSLFFAYRERNGFYVVFTGLMVVGVRFILRARSR